MWFKPLYILEFNYSQISQSKIAIFQTICPSSTSLSYLHTSYKQFLFLLGKLQMLWYNHVQLFAVSYIINCFCHADQIVLYSFYAE